MKRFGVAISVVIAISVCALWALHVRGQQTTPYVEGELIVKVKNWVSHSDVAGIQSTLGASMSARFPSIDAELWKLEGSSVSEALNMYKDDPRFEYVEPNYIWQADETIPNDPRFPDLWGLHNTGQTNGTPDADVDAPEAWDIGRGGDVVVGIIDTGVDGNHPDLSANMYVNPNEIPNNNIDDDNNGFVDDVSGWDFVNNDNDPFDDAGHGTHVAGTIAGVGNNGIGVVGVSWSARIMAIKFLNSNGSGTTTNAIRSVEYANLMGVRVTNNSWGGGGFSQALRDAIETAGDSGFLFAAAAGNNARDTDIFPHYPSSYDLDNIISIASTTHNDTRSGFSNFGLTSVDLGAPGSSILSTIPGGGYGFNSGTSMATPHVSGVVSLLWAAAPSLGHLEVKDKILSSADPIPALAGITVTGARLNAFNALSGLDSIPPAAVTDVAVVSTGSNTATVAWTATGNDGQDGTAAAVDLRYSESPITPANFDAAMAVPGVPPPQPSGSPESFMVTGLDFNTLYHFALKVSDERGNVSDMSNSDSGTTLGIPQIAVAPDTLRDSLLTGGTSSHVVTIQNTAAGTLDFEVSGPLPGWLMVIPASGRVLAASSMDIEVRYDATGLSGADYTHNIIIASNDPIQPNIAVNARLQVTDAPDIALSSTALDYGTRFTGFDYPEVLTVTNIGTAMLNVSGIVISNPEYTVSQSIFSLAPSQSADLIVTFSPVSVGPLPGTLTIQSDDPDQPQADVSLDGTGVVPPDIAISPTSMNVSLLVGQTSVQTLTIDNTGGSDLDFEIEAAEGGLSVSQVSIISRPLFGATAPSTGMGPAYNDGHAPMRDELVLPPAIDFATLGAASSDLSILIIHTGDVSEIQSLLLAFPDVAVVDEFTGVPSLPQLLGYSAVMLMFNSGVPDSETLGNVLADYVDTGGGVIMTLASFISGWEVRGRFLAEGYYPFTLGSGPIGSANLAGFVAAHPIMVGVSSATGSLLGATTLAPGANWVADWDNGQPFIATQGDRVVAVNIFTATGGNWSGDIPLILRNAAAWAADLGSCWLSLDATSGTVPANSTALIQVTFDASSASCVVGGDYFDTLMVTSNDPDEPELNVPLQLQVTDAPHVSLSANSLDFGPVFVGASSAHMLTVTNAGSQALGVTNITSNNPDFTVDLTNFNLSPGQSQDLLVTFAPTTVAPIAGLLTIASNDPDELTVDVALGGDGLDPPRIVLSADSLSETLFTGGTSTQIFTIDNTTGGNELNFQMTVAELSGAATAMASMRLSAPGADGTESYLVQNPTSSQTASFQTALGGPVLAAMGVRDPVGSRLNTGSVPSLVSQAGAGDVIRTIPSPGNLLGLTFLDGSLWAVSATSPQTLVEIDPADGTVLSSFAVGSGFHLGLASDGTNLWVCNFSAGMVEAYTTTGVLVTSWAAPMGNLVRGIGWDGDALWIGGADVGTLYRTDTNGAVLETRTLLASDIQWVMDMEWVEAHPEGPLWIVDNSISNDVNQFDMSQNPVSFLQNFLHPDVASAPEGIAHDGENLWLSGFYAANIYLVDDGVEEIRWLSAEPLEGTVPAGLTMDITVTFDAARLAPGPYDAELLIESNDPLKPEVTVPGHLDVTPAPDITTSSDESDYGDVFIGEDPSQVIVIENEGSALLSVGNIDVDNNDFGVDPTMFDLAPGEKQAVNVTFSPTTNGLITGTMTIRSNDPDEGDVLVALHGDGLKAPSIVITPTSFTEGLYTGETVADTMTITNDGGSFLLFDIDIESSSIAAVAMSSASGGPSSSMRLGGGSTREPILDPRFKGHQSKWLGQHPESVEIPSQMPQGMQATLNGELPVVIDDPAGDGGVVDVTLFRAGARMDAVEFKIEFSTVLNANDLGGYVSLDIDQDPSTGVAPAAGMPAQDIGAEFELSFFNTNFGVVSLYDRINGGFVSDYPVDVQQNSLSFSVPLADLDGDDGNIDVTGVLGTGFGPTDWFPDSGHGTIKRVTWLIADPLTGSLPEGESMDITLLFDAFALPGGSNDADIVITHNDPFNEDIVVAAHLDVTAAPDIAVSETLLDFGPLFIGLTEARVLTFTNEGTELLLVSDITSDDADYGVDLTSFPIVPGGEQQIVVVFHPTIAGPIAATLSIVSNDPDESVMAVSLQGDGVEPPIVGVNPDSVYADLFTGETAMDNVTISNTGGSDLFWTIRIGEKGAGFQQYELTPPTYDPDATIDGAAPPSPGEVRTTSINVVLQSLTGVTIMWDLSHSQISPVGWSILISDLESRGATVTQNFSPFTPQLLQGFDVLWITDSYLPYSSTELNAIADYVKAGGALLVEADDSRVNINPILTAVGTGILYGVQSVASGPTSNIYAHETTTGVRVLNASSGPLAHLQTVQTPAGRLADDINNLGLAAHSQVQSGRVVVVSDELFYQNSIGLNDNQLFGNQVFDWLAGGATWLSADPSSGTVSAGGSQDINVAFDAAGLDGGTYEADIAISSNDPVNPNVNVAARLDVTAAPDIMLSDSDIDYGPLFVGLSIERSLQITNTGTAVLSVSSMSTNNPDFSPNNNAFMLNPGSFATVDITFTPTSLGPIVGTFTITSNDPDEAVVTVSLSGVGLDPPVIGIAPTSLNESLLTGQNATHTVTISNTGGNDLVWLANSRVAGPTVEAYTLSTPEPAPLDGRQPAAGQRSDPVTAILQDLSGIDIMFDRSHNQQFGISSRTTIVTDLTARGATVTENFDPITAEVLAGYDVVWLIDMGSWSQTQEAALADWVRAGGSVCFEYDKLNTVPFVSSILAEMSSGIVPSTGTGVLGSTTNIDPHEITEGVTQLWFNGRRLASISGSAGRLAGDTADLDVSAFDSIDQGRLVVVCDDIFSNGFMSTGDIQLFANQAFDWLAGAVGWIGIQPAAGTIEPGQSQDIDVTFNAFGLAGGAYNADVVVSSNDPANPESFVSTVLDVTAAADIVVSRDEFDFGPLFIGATVSRTLSISNVGSLPLLVNDIGLDNADFTTIPTGLPLIGVGQTVQLEVVFAPTTIGPISGALTLTNNDPDRGTVTVTLLGEGLDPPIIGVAPQSFTESLFTGQAADHTMTIANTGRNDLEWSLGIVTSEAVLQQYTLTAPENEVSDDGDGGIASPPPGARTTPITATLADLTGVDILWDRTHSQGSSVGWSTIVADLVARGATFTENFSVITPQLLADYEILWSIDMFTAWSNNERDALTEWVQGGGGVLFETDQSGLNVNNLLVSMSAGILYSSPGVLPGVTSNVFPHATTVDVGSVFLGGPLARLVPVVLPAGPLVADASGVFGAAFSEVSGGRIVAVSDEMFYNGGLGVADNQLFGNQIIDWLAAGSRWLSVQPTAGTVSPGSSEDVTISFEAFALDGGAYDGDITITSNDPLTPEIVADVHLDVTAAPDITLSETQFDFPPTFVGATPKDTLVILNEGTDVLVVTSISSDNADFSTDVASTSLAPGASQAVELTFAPSSLGPIAGTLTIANNDPDEGAIAIPLSGVGVDPPVIVVSPDSLADSLLTAETSIHQMTISNTGGNDLEWNINITSGDQTTQFYTLTAPSTTESETGDGSVTTPAPWSRTTPISAQLVDLTDVSIMFDRYHNSSPSGNWSIIISDLQARGATVTENFVPITAVVLAEYDVLWSIDFFISWAASELNALDDWVQNGGALLLETDESGSRANDVLTALGAGITYASGGVSAGPTINIHPHPTTENVGAVFIGGPLANLSSIVPPAGRLVDDANDRGAAAFSVVGSGRVFAVCDEIFINAYIGTNDNQLFGNQVFDWLAGGVGWIVADPTSGVVPPGTSSDVEFTFDANRLFGGDYYADVAIRNNDPIDSEVVVPAHLNVTGVPVIAVSDSSFDFGQIFLGTVDTRSLSVVNNGTDDLVVSSIASDHSDYSANPANFTVLPAEVQLVDIVFAPTSLGPLGGTLTINSNDPDDPAVLISVSGDALDPPVVALAPDTLSDSLFTGEQSMHTFTVSNSGGSGLDFTIAAREVPPPAAAMVAELGDHAMQRTDLMQYQSDISPEALARTGSEMSEPSPQQVMTSVYPAETIVLTTVDITESVAKALNALGHAFDLVQTDDFTAIDFSPYKTIIVTMDGGSIEEDDVEALADATSAGRKLIIFGGTSYTPYYNGLQQHLVTHTGAQGWAIAILLLVSDLTNPLAADLPPVHILNNAAAGFHMLRANDNAIETAVINELGTPSLFSKPIGSGRLVYFISSPFSNYWTNAADYQILQTIVRNAMDFGLVPWLEVEPEVGSLQPGESIDIDVTFDASGLDPDDFFAAIDVSSNDPVTPVASVHASLHVIGVPDIAVTDSLLDFGSVIIGLSPTLTTRVSNTGNDNLNVSGITHANTDITVLPTAFTLAPGAWQDVQVNFTPTTPGAFSGPLLITSDDPDEAVVEVAITGEGLDPPQIAVDPTTIVDALLSGETSNHTLTVSNPGGSDLTFSIGTAPSQAVQNPQSLSAAGALVDPSGRTMGSAIPGWNPALSVPMDGDLGPEGSPDGVSAVPWLTVTPLVGTVPANSNVDLDVELDADGLFTGDFAASITIATNVPSTPNVVVPVDLAVTGVPVIGVTPATLDFGNVFVGYPTSLNMIVSNSGTGILTVTSITSDSPEFTAIPTNLALSPSSFQNVAVEVLANSPGILTATLTLTSDDLVNPTLYVTMTANVTTPPVISVPTDSINVTLEIGEAIADTITLANAGGSDLIWSIDLVLAPAASASSEPRLSQGVPGRGVLQKPEAPDIVRASSPQTLGTIDVLWHGNHLFGIQFWSLLIQDLESRGASFTESSATITTGLLAGMDVVWFGDRATALTASEIDALTDWVSDGGNILIEADSHVSATIYNALLAAVNFGGTYITVLDGKSGLTPFVYPHESTNNVATILLGFPDAILSGVGGGGGLLLDDLTQNHIAAYNFMGDGSVVVITDQIFLDPIIVQVDNRLFGNQLFTWFGGTNWLDVDPSGGTLAASGSVELIVSFDSGLLVPGTYYQDIEIDSNDPVTPTITIPVALIVEDAAVVSTDAGSDDPRFDRYVLHPNYPNPFNPTTTIRYELPDAADVRIEVFNAQGERVRVLVDRHQTAGQHTVSWDGRNSVGQTVATGVYFYRLRAGEFNRTRKMQLLK